MAIPTNDSIFAGVRASESWVEYPFLEKGDPTAKIYHMRCRVNRADYSPSIATGTLMTNPLAARVISLPFAPDSGARYVGDFSHSYIDGGLVEFDRQFATIPATRTDELTGSRSFPFPGRREVLYTPPATGEQGDGGNNDNLWDWKETGSGNQSPSPEFTTSQYVLESLLSALPIPDVFKVTLNNNTVDFVTNGGTATFTNSTAINGETFSGGYSVNATSPSASSYASSVASKSKLVVDVLIERYKGDIFCFKTIKAIAK